METDLQGAIEALAAAEALEDLIFGRYERLTNELAPLRVNSPERRAKWETYEPLLELASQSQLRKEQALRRLIEIWSETEAAPIFEALTRLDLPLTNEPIITVKGDEAVTLTRETVQDWILEELALTKDVKL